jgi:hypothetical protein
MAHKHTRSHHKREYPNFYPMVPMDSRMGIYTRGQREAQRRDPEHLKMQVYHQQLASGPPARDHDDFLFLPGLTWPI